MTTCTCGRDLGAEDIECLCPACLLRLALTDPSAEPASRVQPQLLGPIGKGPLGTVHLAMRPGWGVQLVRLKLIEVPTDAERFQARIRSLIDALASVETTGCARMLETGTTLAGLPFVVGEYVPGPSLLDYVSNRRPAAGDRTQLAGRLCSTIADLHRHGIAHGALTSGNVVVAESDEGPSAILLDVGIVPALDPGDALADDRWIAADTRALHGLIGELLGDLASLVAGTESPAMLASTFVHPPG